MRVRCEVMPMPVWRPVMVAYAYRCGSDERGASKVRDDSIWEDGFDSSRRARLAAVLVEPIAEHAELRVVRKIDLQRRDRYRPARHRVEIRSLPRILCAAGRADPIDRIA